MPSDQFKVPEAVWEAYREGYLDGPEAGVAAALKQYNSELLGDEACWAAALVWRPDLGEEPEHSRQADMAEERQSIKAAIDSVVKGGEDG